LQVVVRRALLILFALAVVVGLSPASAPAARGACVAGQPGPSCTVWTGKVVSVNDGDTLDVDVAYDGTSRASRVRITGIQAMEQSAYGARGRQGDCHAVEATQRLEQLVRAGRRVVRLAAEDPESRSRKRLKRTVAVRIRGRWRDAGSILLREGRALWWPARVESAPNVAYRELGRQAIAFQRGLFDPDGCGLGPSSASPLKLWVNWDADGDDKVNPGGEWVAIKNLDPVNPVALGGWYVRDTGLRRYTFPAEAAIAPGATVTLDVGGERNAESPTVIDTAGQTVFQWGLGYPVFANVTNDEDALGDGAYLFDPLGNVRAQMLYPCRIGCYDPAQGTVAVSADPLGRRESVTLTNLTAGAVDLEGYVLKRPPYSYHLGAGAVLPASGSIRVAVRGARENDTALVKHWGLARSILRAAGDAVRLSTYTDLTLACTAWGDRSC